MKAEEVRALGLGFIYYFLILSSYYVIRPIRDDFGTAGGIENLPWMFTGTLVTMLIANALFAALVAKLSRRRFIPIAYRFLSANLLIFFVLLLTISKGNQVWVGRAFFVWTSVFNLFVISVFWASMVDVFSTDQGKRLFGFISVGGTLGAIVGAAITAGLVQKVGTLLGVGVTLAILPALSVLGFTAMGLAPTLALLVIFLTLRRAGNFAIARPARETLFTVVSREDKYKAKNFIDTVVYRAGDQIGAWTSPALGWLGLGLTGVSFVAAPIAAVWLFVSLWLGRKQSAIARDAQPDSSGSTV